jgi:hypothetical protein
MWLTSRNYVIFSDSIQYNCLYYLFLTLKNLFSLTPTIRSGEQVLTLTPGLFYQLDYGVFQSGKLNCSSILR